MPPCSSQELGQMSPKLVSFVGRCGYPSKQEEAESAAHLTDGHHMSTVIPRGSPWRSWSTPSLQKLPHTCGPLRLCPQAWHCDLSCCKQADPSFPSCPAFTAGKRGCWEVPQFAAARSWPLLGAELMLLNSPAIKLAQVKMIDFSFPFSSCKQWHNGTKWLFWNKQCIF